MTTDKPIVVRHPDFWRRYRSDRELLRSVTLGDLIPSHQAEWCGNPVLEHLYSRPGAPADIIAVEDPREEDWARMTEILTQIETATAYLDPLISNGA